MAKVFLVDDRPFMHNIYSELLGMAGQELVGTAVNGEGAVREISGMKGVPDLVILEYRLNWGSGLDVAKDLMKLYPGLNFIITSADEKIKEEALEQGAAGFLLEPIKMDHFISELNRICTSISSDAAQS